MEIEGTQLAGGAVSLAPVQAPQPTQPAAPAEAQAPADQSTDFGISLDLASTAETHEEAQNREAVAALESEAQGWIDPTKGSVKYESTGDAALDVALGFLAKHGYSHHHPAVQAAAQGNFGLLEAELAGKGIAGWEQHVALGKEAFGRGAEQAKLKNHEIKQICLHATNGDEALWGDTLSHWSQNAEPAEKKAVNAALAGGGILAEAMSAYMVQLFKQSSGVSYNPAVSVVNQSATASAAGAGSGPLSPAAYTQAVMSLRQKVGSNIDGHPEYAKLQSRRAQYRG